MFICRQKTNFILHAFLKTDCWYFCPKKLELCQIWDWCWNIKTFILDYFQEKLMTNFFKKSKGIILGSIWALFAQIWSKMNLGGKDGSASFQIFQLFTIMSKIRLMSHSWGKYWTNGCTYRQTDRKTGNSDFMEPSATYKSLDHKANMQIFRWPLTRKQFTYLRSTTSKNGFLKLTSTGLTSMIFYRAWESSV